ncbi:uncharacterized protein [Haliotis asinina]|uniref:uncharacterized protein n=1 Tax=Haliotis asinina TaxID=109174 RepID=UPI0035325002
MFVLHLVFVIMSVHSSHSFPLTCTLVVINKSANKTKDGIEIIPNVEVDASSYSFGPSTTDTSTTPGKDAASQPYTDSNGAGIERTLSTSESSSVTQPESANTTAHDNQTSATESTVSSGVDKLDGKTIAPDTSIKDTTTADVTVESKPTSDATEETTHADTTVKETTSSPVATRKETTADTTVKETTSIPYYDDENIRVMVDPPETSSTEQITVPQTTTIDPPVVLDY